MNLIAKKTLNSWIINTLFLAMVFSLVNCNCDSKNNPPKRIDQDGGGDQHRENKSALKIELTAASDEVIDSDIIEFQLVNKGTEEIDLAQIIVNLEITEKKDALGHQINTGEISPILLNKSLYMAGGKTIPSKPVIDFTEDKKLTTGKKTSIFIRLLELDGLSTGLVKCQLESSANQNIEIAQKTVSFKFTKSIGPKEDSSLEVKIKDVKFIGNTNELSFGIKIKNTSNHPISLGSLKFNFDFDGPMQGEIEYTPLRLFKQANSILESGQEIEITADPITFTDIKQIDGLKNAIGTDNFFLITPHVTTKNSRKLYDTAQFVKLISPDLPEIGPKQGSKIEHMLDTQKIVFENGELTFPIVFHNTSDHTIDLKELEHEVNINDAEENLISIQYDGSKINWRNSIIKKEETTTFEFVLQKNITDLILANSHNTTHNLEFLTKSKKDGQVVGEIKQLFKVKVGPISGESTVDVIIADNIGLRYVNTQNKHQAVFTTTITNTSDYIINLKDIAYDYTIFITTTGQVLNDPFNGEERLNNIFLEKGQSQTLNFPLNLDNMSEEKAKNFLSVNNFFFEFTMKTLDGKYVVGTNKKEVKFNKS